MKQVKIIAKMAFDVADEEEATCAAMVLTCFNSFFGCAWGGWLNGRSEGWNSWVQDISIPLRVSKVKFPPQKRQQKTTLFLSNQTRINSYLCLTATFQNVSQAILEVFPRLINQMIVEMMKPDASKSAAIATFEALCNFWRTFRWLVDTRVKLRKMVATRLMGFVKEENNRWAWCSFFVVVVTAL